MVWFWQEIDPQIRVIHSLIIQATFAISHTFSPKQNKTIEDNEGDMMVEIDTNIPSSWDIDRKTNFKKKYS